MLEKGTVETFIVSSLYCCIVETGMLASFTEMGACVPAMSDLLVIVPLLEKMPIKNYKLECARQLQFHLGMTIKTTDMDAHKEKFNESKISNCGSQSA